jgi:hypothetical protein
MSRGRNCLRLFCGGLSSGLCGARLLGPRKPHSLPAEQENEWLGGAASIAGIAPDGPKKT